MFLCVCVFVSVCECHQHLSSYHERQQRPRDRTLLAFEPLFLLFGTQVVSFALTKLLLSSFLLKEHRHSIVSLPLEFQMSNKLAKCGSDQVANCQGNANTMRKL